MAEILALATAARGADEVRDTEHRRFPRVEYVELQRRGIVDVLDYGAYPSGTLGRALGWAETRLHSDLFLAALGLLKQRAGASLFCMSERVGTPIAALSPARPARRRWTRFTSWSARQEGAVTRLRLLPRMGRIIVHSSAQRECLVRLGADPARVQFLPYAVDQRFFAPPSNCARERFVLSLGEPRGRHYATLFAALAGTNIHAVVLASGLAYARQARRELADLPPVNVALRPPLPHDALRQLYAQAAFVVLPLRDAPHTAGATTLLETMCMARAAVVTRSAGIRDYAIDGETAVMVDDDPVALRAAIVQLWNEPERARRLGDGARQRVEAELSFEQYVDGLAGILGQDA